MDIEPSASLRVSQHAPSPQKQIVLAIAGPIDQRRFFKTVVRLGAKQDELPALGLNNDTALAAERIDVGLERP